MKFGTIATSNAHGVILAHSLRAGDLHLKKGQVLDGAQIAALEQAGIFEINAAILSATDIGEDIAAQKIGEALQNANIGCTKPVAGRVNLLAGCDGVVTFDIDQINAMNNIDESITIATLPNHSRVAKGALVATIKIIPYAVDKNDLNNAISVISDSAAQLFAFKPKSVDLILTKTAGFKDSVLAKGEKIIASRVAPLNMSLNHCETVLHAEDAIKAGIKNCRSDIILLLGASATSDRRDVIPGAIERAGGQILRYGMPVDPGNLLVLGHIDGRPVVGLPGCARAPALNGVDWVLERLAAGIDVQSNDIAAMGVGGLLKEIPNRIQPRAKRAKVPTLNYGVMLAAGASRRMGDQDKLLREIDGVPLLRRSVETMLAAGFDKCVVTLRTGADAHRAALAGLDVEIQDVMDAEQGMSASIRAAVGCANGKAKTITFALADMPDIRVDHFNALLSAHDPNQDRLIICPKTSAGTRGNPVLFDARFSENLKDISGDKGARDVLRAVPEFIHEIDMDDAVAIDLDTPEAWKIWESKNN
ncbi:4-diphosphocytidyl-2C-methyl-D-erythritol kinase [Amylibacter ulvae]|uniref:4-diphosphocytidyl-2C-methyl-D-erythritol kinase n=1 Tax=Paramylibacter ulvae TaxID=1651968 RepID=A0ABQ3CUZ2_9RHOB|nr:molybdopterin-binding/glycosyltransferase family 2 protein [Amylibacter ulvae]GHA42574.1 4-diphosphocytidyl-2C-methyl-D-erythritol kinase [Amylibacter ulvae]